MKIEFGGLGVFLFVTFLVLKLTGHIAWSWWWVTAPLWIPTAIGVAVWSVIVAATVVVGVVGRLIK